VDLGVTVLSSLGGRHVDDLTGSSLDEDVSTLPEGRTLGAVLSATVDIISSET